MENTCVKYAVYTTRDGKEVLEVVRDTEDLAKSEKESLKGSATHICIKKSTVQNFGQSGEKVIDSQIIDSWDKSQESNIAGGDKLSEHYKKTEAVVQQPPPPVNQIMAQPVIKNDWRNHYANKGDILGLGYYFGTPEEQPAPQMNIGGSVVPPNIPPVIVPPTGRPPVVPVVNEEKQKRTKEISDTLGSTRAQNVRMEGDFIHFDTNDQTDYKELMKMLAKAGVELKGEEGKYKVEVK